jgi:ankyrin repeat protein
MNTKTYHYDKLILPHCRKCLHNELLVRWHLVNGADPNLCPDTGVTILACAARESSLEVVKLLVEQGAKIKHSSALHEAASVEIDDPRFIGRLEAMAYLLDQGADINALEPVSPGRNILPGTIITRGTALRRAMVVRNTETVKFLLGRGADWRVHGNTGYTPFEMAQNMGFEEIIEILSNY